MNTAIPALDRRVMHRALPFLLLAFVFGPELAAPAADDFYKGKTITLVVSMPGCSPATWGGTLRASRASS